MGVVVTSGQVVTILGTSCNRLIAASKCRVAAKIYPISVLYPQFRFFVRDEHKFTPVSVLYRPAKSQDLGRITGFFIALPALRLLRENLRQNHKISGILFSDSILKFTNKINWSKKLRSHLLLGKQIGRSRFQKTTDLLIATGVKQINSLGVNIWRDNKLQITIFSIVEAYKKIPLVRKMKRTIKKKKEYVGWDFFQTFVSTIRCIFV